MFGRIVFGLLGGIDRAADFVRYHLGRGLELLVLRKRQPEIVLAEEIEPVLTVNWDNGVSTIFTLALVKGEEVIGRKTWMPSTYVTLEGVINGLFEECGLPEDERLKRLVAQKTRHQYREQVLQKPVNLEATR